MNPVIVIPVPAPPSPQFLSHLPTSIPIIMVEDSPQLLPLDRKRYQIYGYQEQRQILGNRYAGFLEFHHAAAVRNFGHYLAWKQGFDPIIALDYDCVVPKNFVSKHLAALSLAKAPVAASTNGWINPLNSTTWFSRGYPYEYRYPSTTAVTIQPVNVAFNMGLWNHVIDINGIDKVIQKPPTNITLKRPCTVAHNMLPISGMNNCFRAPLTPAYCLLPNVTVGPWHLSRHDDIWGGYILKRLMDIKGDQVSFGEPVVRHTRQSWLPGVLDHEHPMQALDRDFYYLVDEAVKQVKPTNYTTMFSWFVTHFYQTLRSRASTLPPHYQLIFTQLLKGMQWWAILFQTQS